MARLFLRVSQLWLSGYLVCLLAGSTQAQIPEYEMVPIEAGTFMMGSSPSEALSREDERLHQVTLTRDILMGSHEVTQAFYAEVTGTNPSYNNVCAECPVEMITWREAIVFCNLLSRRTGLPVAYTMQGDVIEMDLDGPGFRLPTEAEWEYACRAGSETIFPGGNCLSSAEANYNAYRPQPDCEPGLNRAETVPVGSFPPNRWGLYDMIGNVSEFCWDWHAYYPGHHQLNPTGGPPATYRVLRGGTFANFAGRCHSASRQRLEPDRAVDMTGFRMVRTADARENKRHDD